MRELLILERRAETTKAMIMKRGHGLGANT